MYIIYIYYTSFMISPNVMHAIIINPMDSYTESLLFCVCAWDLYRGPQILWLAVLSMSRVNKLYSLCVYFVTMLAVTYLVFFFCPKYNLKVCLGSLCHFRILMYGFCWKCFVQSPGIICCPPCKLLMDKRSSQQWLPLNAMSVYS